MPLDIRSTRTITRTATIALSTSEVETAIRQYIVREEKSLKDYTLIIGWGNDGGITVTGTLTTEREQQETGA